jgi:hypothetical protein
MTSFNFVKIVFKNFVNLKAPELGFPLMFQFFPQISSSAHTQYKLKIWTFLPGSSAFTQYARKDITLMLSMRGRLFCLC